MELLKRIELRMEFLTQDLERLPAEKVKIAQRVKFSILSRVLRLGQIEIIFEYIVPFCLDCFW
jgi:hypothetical protein